MEVRIHLPGTKEGWEMLNERMAEIHSEFIIDQINNLPCSYEKKLEVLEGVRRKIEEDEESEH